MTESKRYLSETGVDVRELAEFVWARRMLVIVVVGLATTAACAYAFLAPATYRAEAIVQPRGEASGLNGVRALTAQLGGLVDLANLGGGLGDDRDVAIATLQSRAIIEPFIAENSVLQDFYSDEWDPEAHQWTDPDDPPTTWRAYNDFKENVLSITENPRTGLVTLRVDWRDPQKAKDWAAEIIRRTNAHLKAKAISEGEGNLAYLEGQSRKVQQVELQQSVYNLVEAEMKKLMLAKGGEEFAVKVIDPPVVPQERFRPRRAFIVLATFAISLIGVVGVLLAWAGMREPVT